MNYQNTHIPSLTALPQIWTLHGNGFDEQFLLKLADGGPYLEIDATISKDLLTVYDTKPFYIYWDDTYQKWSTVLQGEESNLENFSTNYFLVWNNSTLRFFQNMSNINLPTPFTANLSLSQTDPNSFNLVVTSFL